ncbi:MAG TPA: hypothetical protein VLH60_04930 [Sedimentisphaerales bacterium]|nr:hypothetical protein [Sedimentisphaerales bacterium]
MKTHFGLSRHHARSCAVLLCALFAGGCADYSRQNDALRAKLMARDKEAAAMRRTVAELTAAGEECRQQVATLQGLSEEQRRAGVPEILDVIIVRRTGIYDAEKAGEAVRLMVYFRPIDDVGDAVKAAGHARVGLWDLSAEPAKARLAEWDISFTELKRMWSGSMLSNFYRLELPVPQDYAARKDLTVKLTFTDYFTGRTFSRQLAIKSR